VPPLREQTASERPQADVDPCQFPPVRDFGQVDIRRANDLDSSDVDQLMIEQVSGQNNIVLVPLWCRDKKLL
jgi:hypothetical protein